MLSYGFVPSALSSRKTENKTKNISFIRGLLSLESGRHWIEDSSHPCAMRTMCRRIHFWFNSVFALAKKIKRNGFTMQKYYTQNCQSVWRTGSMSLLMDELGLSSIYNRIGFRIPLTFFRRYLFLNILWAVVNCSVYIYIYVEACRGIYHSINCVFTRVFFHAVVYISLLYFFFV